MARNNTVPVICTCPKLHAPSTPCLTQRCQCEAAHHGDGPCSRDASVTVLTPFGRFRNCGECANNYFVNGYGFPEGGQVPA